MMVSVAVRYLANSSGLFNLGLANDSLSVYVYYRWDEHISPFYPTVMGPEPDSFIALRARIAGLFPSFDLEAVS